MNWGVRNAILSTKVNRASAHKAHSKRGIEPRSEAYDVSNLDRRLELEGVDDAPQRSP